MTLRAQQIAASLPQPTADTSRQWLVQTAAAVSLPLLFSSSTGTAETPLPEAPDPQGVGLRGTPDAAKAQHVVPRNSKYIPAGWTAQPLSFKLKVAMGAHDLYSVSNFGAMFLSAGYSQITNAQPNYGTDKGAFGERLGAAAIRETTEGVFTDMVFAPLLHEDSRYYQLGPQHNVVRRTLYSISRPLVTKKDNGGSTVNGALLLGYAASTAMNAAYYPQSNRNVHDAAASFGGSIGGAALGFFVSEFTSDLLEALHLKKPE